MYNISNTATKSAVEAALAAQTRVFKHRISFGSLSAVGVFTAQKTIDEGIISLHISQQMNGNGSGLVMGCCCAACADTEFYNPDKTFVYKGKTLFVECGIQLEDGSFYYIPLGYYKTEKPESDDDYYTVKIKCYDAVNAMTSKWQSSLSFPSATAYDILFETASKYGVGIVIGSSIMRTKLRNRYVTAEEAAILGQYTDREVIGILAGLVGCNARINTVGKLAVGWYSGSVSIPAELQWQNGFKKTQEAAFMISSVTSGSDDNVFTAGTGSGISFVNPIITEDEITAIYGEISDYEFQPCECEWRGNPCVEVGDKAVVTDRKGKTYSVYIAAQELDLTGGLSSTVSCPAGDAEVSFDTVDERTRSALNKQRTTLQEAIIAASNAINGALGGYLKIGDSDGDGNPDYMLITENANGEAVSGSATNGYIMFNKAGIGLSVDGGKTYRTAITFSGINADCITTGKLSADLIDTRRLVVGGESHDSLEGLLNAIAETADSSVTNVDVLYARNQSATEAPPAAAWSTDSPTWAEGYYIWTKTKITAGGTDSYTEPVCITGAKGAQGADGKAGRGVTKIEEQYYLSTSGSTPTGGSWSTAQPEWKKDHYIWTRSHITWSDETTSYTDPVLAKAINGANSVAGDASSKLAEWCYENDKTFIDGSKIYTGSIAANSIDVSKLKAGTGELVNLFYNADFSKSTTSVWGWQGYNTLLTRERNYVSAKYLKMGANLIDHDTSEFVTTNKWKKQNATFTKPFESVDYIEFVPSSTTKSAMIWTPVKLKNGKKYSVSAQINVTNWAKIASGANPCMGVMIGNSAWYTTYGDASNFTPATGEYNIEFVFTYTDATSDSVDVGLAFYGMLTSDNSSPKINIAWIACCEVENTREYGFYTSNVNWLANGYKTSHLVNNGNLLNTADKYLAHISTTQQSQLQIVLQKRMLEKGKRYVMLARLKFLNLTEVNSGAALGWWHGSGYWYDNTTLISSTSTSDYFVAKFVFDYNEDTGIRDVGIQWKGILDDASQPCEVRLRWFQLYQDDTAPLGFYASDASWLQSAYKESNLITYSSTPSDYNKKSGLIVNNNNLYFYGNVVGNVGNIGCLQYAPTQLNVSGATYYFEDAANPSTSTQESISSSLKIRQPDSIIDFNLDSYEKVNVSAYTSAHMTLRSESSGDEWDETDYTPAGVRCTNHKKRCVTLTADGIGLKEDGSVTLTWKQLYHLAQNTSET